MASDPEAAAEIAERGTMTLVDSVKAVVAVAEAAFSGIWVGA